MVGTELEGRIDNLEEKFGCKWGQKSGVTLKGIELRIVFKLFHPQIL